MEKRTGKGLAVTYRHAMTGLGLLSALTLPVATAAETTPLPETTSTSDSTWYAAQDTQPQTELTESAAPVFTEATLEPSAPVALEPSVAPSAEVTIEPSPAPSAVVTLEPTSEPTPPASESPEPVPTTVPEPTSDPQPSVEPEPTLEPEPTGEPAPEPTAEPTSEPVPTEDPAPTSDPVPTSVPEPTGAPTVLPVDPTASPAAPAQQPGQENGSNQQPAEEITRAPQPAASNNAPALPSIQSQLNPPAASANPNPGTETSEPSDPRRSTPSTFAQNTALGLASAAPSATESRPDRVTAPLLPAPTSTGQGTGRGASGTPLPASVLGIFNTEHTQRQTYEGTQSWVEGFLNAGDNPDAQQTDSNMAAGVAGTEARSGNVGTVASGNVFERGIAIVTGSKPLAIFTGVAGLGLIAIVANFMRASRTTKR